jgi:hypothetical protein
MTDLIYTDGMQRPRPCGNGCQAPLRPDHERHTLLGCPTCRWCGSPFFPRVSDWAAEFADVDYMDAARPSVCRRCERPFLRDLALREAARKRANHVPNA